MRELLGLHAMAVPLALGGFLVLAMAAKQLGRRRSNRIFLSLLALPWLLSAAVYLLLRRDPEQADMLRDIWTAPLWLTAFAVIVFGIVLLRTERG